VQAWKNVAVASSFPVATTLPVVASSTASEPKLMSPVVPTTQAASTDAATPKVAVSDPAAIATPPIVRTNTAARNAVNFVNFLMIVLLFFSHNLSIVLYDGMFNFLTLFPVLSNFSLLSA
jgi:hypothetical protein